LSWLEAAIILAARGGWILNHYCASAAFERCLIMADILAKRPMFLVVW